jgi:transcriptional regulator with XRE-family HTH domain
MKTPLRLARERSGLTIVQVSAAAGIDPGNLSRIERGVQVPSRDLAERLAQQFVGHLNELQIIYPERYSQPEAGNA